MFLETLAFTLVIGAQFAGAIYLLSNRSRIYGEPPVEGQADRVGHQRLGRPARERLSAPT